jgi:hypothetical protein
VQNNKLPLVLERISKIDDQITTLESTFMILEEEEQQEENSKATHALKRVRELELKELARLERYMTKLKGEADLQRLAYMHGDDLLKKLEREAEGTKGSFRDKKHLAHHKNKRLEHMTELKHRRKQGEAVDLDDLREEEADRRGANLAVIEANKQNTEDYKALSSLGFLLKRKMTLQNGDDNAQVPKLSIAGKRIEEDGLWIDDDGQCHEWSDDQEKWIMARPVEKKDDADPAQAHRRLERARSLARRELSNFVKPTKKRPNHIKTGLTQSESGAWRAHRDERIVDPWAEVDAHSDEEDAVAVAVEETAVEDGSAKCSKCGATFVCDQSGPKSRLCGDCTMAMKKKKREMMLKKKKAQAIRDKKKKKAEDAAAAQSLDDLDFDEGRKFDVYAVKDPTGWLPDECVLWVSGEGMSICPKEDEENPVYSVSWEMVSLEGSSAPDPEDMDDLTVTMEVEGEEVDMVFECDDKWQVIADVCTEYKEGGSTATAASVRTMKIMV